MEPNNIETRLAAVEKKLDDVYTITVKMRKSQRTAATVRSLYWIFIILLSFGAFYFVQPYIGQLKEAYGLGGGSDTGNFNELFKQLNSQNDK